MKSYFSIWIFLVISLNGVAQSINLSFGTTVQNEWMEVEKPCSLNSKDTIRVSQLKFYISNIQLLKDNHIVFSELNSFHLIDFSNAQSTKLNIKTFGPVEFNLIKFNLGIDSVTNVDGVKGGDLDPTHGMYWTWQSGYINIKIEGVYKKDDKANDFQLHLGGYQTPFNGLQEISIKTQSTTIDAKLELESLFRELGISAENNIMSPSYKAVELAALIAKSISLNKHD
jgi:hypothetical protein